MKNLDAQPDRQLLLRLEGSRVAGLNQLQDTKKERVADASEIELQSFTGRGAWLLELFAEVSTVDDVWVNSNSACICAKVRPQAKGA